jgi:hypothetical protein
MSLIVTLVLICTLFSVVGPGVGALMWQMAFVLSGVADEVTQIGAAPTTGGDGAGSARGHRRAAVALEGDVLWTPLVDLAERDFAGLVVRLDALDDVHHRLLPLSPTVCSAGRSCSAAG